MSDEEQLPLVDAPERVRPDVDGALVEWPPWFYVGKNTPATHIRNVARGRHPFGEALGPEGETCGGCRFAYPKTYSKTYWKCSKGRNTGGPGTDLRKKWRACRLFEPKEEESTDGER